MKITVKTAKTRFISDKL